MQTSTTDGAAPTSDDPVFSAAISEMTDDLQALESVDQEDGSEPQDDPGADSGDTDTGASTTDTDPGDDGARPQAGQQADAAVTDAANANASDAATTDDTDPLAGTEPFTFTVDGQTRQMEGVYRIPGEGLVVPEDRVPQMQLMASRSESLEKQNRELYQRTQEIDRLTSWTTKAQDGSELKLSGREAIEASRVSLGQTAAALETIAGVFKGSPLGLISTDAQGNVVWNQDALRNLLTEAKLASVTAEQSVRRHFSTLASQPATSTQPEVDIVQAAPVLVQNIASQLGAKGLTADDSKFLAGQLPLYVRAATAKDAAENPEVKVGQKVIDTQFHALIQRQSALRAETSAVAKTATSATRFNQGQERGRQRPTAQQTPAKTTTPTHAPTKSAGKQAQWDQVFQDALSEMATG